MPGFEKLLTQCVERTEFCHLCLLRDAENFLVVPVQGDKGELQFVVGICDVCLARDENVTAGQIHHVIQEALKNAMH